MTDTPQMVKGMAGSLAGVKQQLRSDIRFEVRVSGVITDRYGN